MLNLKKDSNWLKIHSKQYNTEPEKFIKKREKVSTISLNDYCIKNKIKKIDILKIDTQAFEDRVIMGSLDLIKNNFINFLEIEIIKKEAYENNFHFVVT